MNMTCNRKTGKAAVLLAMAAASLSACSDWTDPESLGINFQGQDKTRYEAHLAEVRAYKEGDHKIMVIKMDNKALPGSRADHLSSVPDSVDYVVLNTYDNLSAEVAVEIGEARDRKGIKTLLPIDFQQIEAAYEQEAASEETALQEEGEEEPTEETDPFIDFCNRQMDAAMEAYTHYGYAGIDVVYNGTFPFSLPSEEQEVLKKRQEFFIGKIETWADANPEAVLLFEGKPQNLFGNIGWLEKADYVIVNVEAASTMEEQLIAVDMAKVEGVPESRLLLGVSAIVAGSKEGEGFLDVEDGNGLLTSLQGAVQVLSRKEAGYLRGICVNHAQYDYYYADRVYKNIRAALYAISHL